MKQLFNIINALTMNEKRYFKTLIRSKSASQLFDIINRHPNDFSAINDFTPREKNYLLNTLLRTLREFHSDMSANRQLDDYIHEVDILINKELYEEALSRIKKAEKMANKHEKTNHKIILSRLKRKIHHFRGNENDNYSFELSKKIILLSQQLVIEAQLEEIITRYRVEAFSNNGLILEKALQQLIKKIPKELYSTFTSHYLYARVLSFIYSESGRFHESYMCYKKLTNHFEQNIIHLSNSSLDPYSTINYIAILHNQLNMIKSMGNLPEYMTVIEKLKNTRGLSPRESNKSFLNFSISLTDFYLSKNEIEKGVEFVNTNRKKIESIFSEPDRIEMLYFNAAYLYFLSKNFKESHRMLFKYLSMKNPRYKSIFKAALFINILLQLELGKNDFASHLLDKLSRKLKASEQHSAFDETLSDLVKNILAKAQKNVLEKKLQVLKELTTRESRQKSATNLNAHFNFTGWAESKIYNIPFRT